MSKHLTRAQLEALQAGTLDDTAAVEHFERCDTCRKALGELRLDETFLSLGATASDHPDPEVLALFADDDDDDEDHADGRELARARHHVALCRRCREEVAGIRRTLAAEPEFDAPAELIHRIKRELAPSTSRGRVRRLGTWLVAIGAELGAQVGDDVRARFTDLSPAAPSAALMPESIPELMEDEGESLDSAAEELLPYGDETEHRDFETVRKEIRALAARGRRAGKNPLADVVESLSRARAAMRSVQTTRAKPQRDERELLVEASATIEAALDAALKLHEQLERSTSRKLGIPRRGRALEASPAADSFWEPRSAYMSRSVESPGLPGLDALDVDVGPLHVRVEATPATEPPGIALTVTVTRSPMGKPASRTLVALHPLKGVPTEQWTDADGRVRFPPAHGQVTLRIHADPDHDLVLQLPV